MGLWNSHTSLGNIFGSLIAGAFVQVIIWLRHCFPWCWILKCFSSPQSNWGLSFTVPGVIIAGVGFLLFLVMVPRPQDLGFSDEVEIFCYLKIGMHMMLFMCSSFRICQMKTLRLSHFLMRRMVTRRKNQPTVSTLMCRCLSYFNWPGQCHLKVRGGEEEAISFKGALKIPGVVEFSIRWEEEKIFSTDFHQLFSLFFAKLVSYTFLYWLPNYIHVMDKVRVQLKYTIESYSHLHF